jgi:hypothetical protein
VIRAVRRKMRLPELDAATVPRVALLGIALSAFALVVAIAALAVVVIGLGHKADRADLRATSAETRAVSSQAQAQRIVLAFCRLSYVQRPNAPGIAAPSTDRGSDLAPYWQDLFASINCGAVPRAELERPPAAPSPPVPSRSPGG